MIIKTYLLSYLKFQSTFLIFSISQVGLITSTYALKKIRLLCLQPKIPGVCFGLHSIPYRIILTAWNSVHNLYYSICGIYLRVYTQNGDAIWQQLALSRSRVVGAVVGFHVTDGTDLPLYLPLGLDTGAVHQCWHTGGGTSSQRLTPAHTLLLILIFPV